MFESSETKDKIVAVSDNILREAERVFSEHGRFTEEVLSGLHFVFQAPLLSALELVDKDAVSKLVSPSGRSIYQCVDPCGRAYAFTKHSLWARPLWRLKVIGSSGSPYACFETSHYCSCPAFRYSVLHKEDHMMCKHHLAIRLSNIMGRTKSITVTDKHLADILAGIE